MKRVIIVAACVVLFALSGCALRKEIVIPRAKIQETVSKKFPYNKDVGLARFTIQAPEVYFKGKNIGFKALYSGNLLEREIRGSVDVHGNIVYKPETGSFYLHEFEIADITVNENNILEKVKFQKIVDTIISNYLDGFRIYRLDPHDYKENLARSFVKDVFIRNDDLVIVIGN